MLYPFKQVSVLEAIYLVQAVVNAARIAFDMIERRRRQRAAGRVRLLVLARWTRVLRLGPVENEIQL